jgi:hypothetical protein
MVHYAKLNIRTWQMTGEPIRHRSTFHFILYAQCRGHHVVGHFNLRIEKRLIRVFCIQHHPIA